MAETLDDVLYKWACSVVVPFNGLPSNESEIRQVHSMMTHGVKLLQLAQSPAYDNFRMQEILNRVKELAETSNGGKNDVAIGVRVELIKGMIADFERSAFGAGEDRLYKTAQTLLDLYAEYGPDRFKRLFRSLNILDACRLIVAEGERNPHPWPQS